MEPGGTNITTFDGKVLGSASDFSDMFTPTEDNKYMYIDKNGDLDNDMDFSREFICQYED